jgi:hypothetical protein
VVKMAERGSRVAEPGEADLHIANGLVVRPHEAAEQVLASNGVTAIGEAPV